MGHTHNEYPLAATLAYGKQTVQDGFAAYSEEMLPAWEAKRTESPCNNMNPSLETRTNLRLAKSALEQTAKQCAQSYWLILCMKIQTFFETRGLRGMYDGIQKSNRFFSQEHCPT